MALYKTDAIVLGHRNLGEADKILTLFSPDRGKIHAVARGVRRPRNPILAGSQLFSYSKFLIVEGRNLDSISQCEIKESFYKIRQNLESMAYGLYFAELLRASTPVEDKNRELFRFFLKTMYLLQEMEDKEILSRIYEIKLMAIQGFAPEVFVCVNCGRKVSDKISFSPAMGGILCHDCKKQGAVSITPDTLSVLQKMLTMTYEELKDITLNKYTREQLSEILSLFISHQIDRKLKTVEFIKDVKKLNIKSGL
ncbi:MAG TPA: DNA repair protein RecO [Thermoanaerobacterales bacterium]|uniref:DNA repair protein RecO n=1 Tax=Tepidanaerobacter sp. GT38 TaxID=2722793 RepID=UPI0017BCC90F|nr:DNA repair protein RecO [Tepidanaerobacter sp. GT38]MCG1012720.1 DNA repair protein RecO [Tepidanaerobacter sp. GT38]HHY42630.1 DNA repair protein RecO [Thermoanaerobacterales bacterium]